MIEQALRRTTERHCGKSQHAEHRPPHGDWGTIPHHARCMRAQLSSLFTLLGKSTQREPAASKVQCVWARTGGATSSACRRRTCSSNGQLCMSQPRKPEPEKGTSSMRRVRSVGRTWRRPRTTVSPAPCVDARGRMLRASPLIALFRGCISGTEQG